MRISIKVACGIAAITDIAVYSQSGESVTVYNISQRENISVKYLEQILPALRQANLIQGTKGCRGGYTMSRSTSSITLREIIDALDITILNDCGDSGGDTSVINEIVYECFWSKATSYLQQCAESITLETIAAKCRESTEESSGSYMYYI